MHTIFTPETILQRNESKFLASTLGEETVMMDLENGDYLGLNSVGTDIWNLLQQPISLETLLQKLKEVYDVSEEQLNTEVDSFLQKMQEQNMLQVIVL
jgi:hypothetical protein